MHDLFTEQIMQDDIVRDAILALKTQGTPPIKSSLLDWKVENGLLFFKDRCYVPNNEELRRQLVEKYHNSLPSRHPGQWQTTQLVWRDYWRPGMITFIKNFVLGCATCQQMKVNTHLTTLPLSPIKSDATCLLRSVPFLGLRTISALILDSDICHYHYASHINSLSFRITFPTILIVPGPQSETR